MTAGKKLASKLEIDEYKFRKTMMVKIESHRLLENVFKNVKQSRHLKDTLFPSYDDDDENENENEYGDGEVMVRW